ncbi:unnamed protein product, partial [Ixodes persulcatus]
MPRVPQLRCARLKHVLHAVLAGPKAVQGSKAQTYATSQGTPAKTACKKHKPQTQSLTLIWLGKKKKKIYSRQTDAKSTLTTGLVQKPREGPSCQRVQLIVGSTHEGEENSKSAIHHRFKRKKKSLRKSCAPLRNVVEHPENSLCSPNATRVSGQARLLETSVESRHSTKSSA